MPNNYLKSLEKEGNHTMDKLEQKWKNASKKAKEQDQGDNYAYITAIFNKMITEANFNELLMLINNKLKKEDSPNEKYQTDMSITGQSGERKGNGPGKGQGPTPGAGDGTGNCLKMGKYVFNMADKNGQWNKGDTINVKDNTQSQDIGGTEAFSVNVNGKDVYTSKEFVEYIGELDEEGDAGGDSGANMTSTADVGGYEAPFNKVQKRKKPDQFWGDSEDISEEDDELDEDGTDFSYTWGKVKDGEKKSQQPDIDPELAKKLKIHSPEIVQK